jgi:hypothetical protein
MKKRKNDLADILSEDDAHGNEGAKMNIDIERKHIRILDVQQMLAEDEVAGAADREKLRQSLKDTKNERLKK